MTNEQKKELVDFCFQLHDVPDQSQLPKVIEMLQDNRFVGFRAVLLYALDNMDWYAYRSLIVSLINDPVYGVALFAYDTCMKTIARNNWQSAEIDLMIAETFEEKVS